MAPGHCCGRMHRFSSRASFDTRLAVTQTPAGARCSQCSSFLPPKHTKAHQNSCMRPRPQFHCPPPSSHGAKRARRPPGNHARISSEHCSAEEARQASRRQWCTVMQHQLCAAARRCPPPALSPAGLARIEAGGKNIACTRLGADLQRASGQGARGPASVARQSAGWSSSPAF